ncbi:hypothetical protein [Methylobacterium sp. V23]|uniref:hypothetical protein n=1 Tax=Methylobacterium sp. V23 TaxID=2044878 RepID=UPI000CDA02C6|nr:hypothetical protein [Methylobacterium sp. V23]POR40518.1 hypothetical protein CRT23_23485 [Methylobacterium sp. V23]
MHDDAEDHATLKRHHERLELLYAELERSQSRETIAAMLGVCAAVRRVDNPHYRYAVEQIVWIKGPLEAKRDGIDLAAVHQGIARLVRALRSPALRDP